MFVFDATPLIYLAMVERVALLSDLPAECVIPEQVYDEVVTTGINQGHTDAKRIDRAVTDELLVCQSVSDTRRFERLQTNDHLSEADAAVLTIAATEDGTAVMDEKYGRDVAAAEGIETKGTAYLILWLLHQEVLTPSEARSVIDEMVNAGWYCAPNLYAKLVRKIEEFE
jgi:predicted nucleic acid-binding protein